MDNERITIRSVTGPASNAQRLITRWVAIGAIGAGIAGAVAGLWIGLVTHPATAWFAVFELGVPASILGGLIGLVGGAVAYAVQRGTAGRGRDPVARMS